ncbi:MAG: acetate--CoA ligase family protein [Patescibacteria group bacterium]|jgi:acetyl coenzyme A synthetase (ADP forming)-like protein|nr:acetate--CoA ligase family protein [Patescibacteria group bacterium]
MKNLDKLFKPSSVALVGASNEKGSVGKDLIDNLKNGYKGKVYPVNLKSKKIADLKAYSSLSKIKGSVDLMLIAVPAKIVPRILEEGGKKGIRAAVVISAGFKEVGNNDLEKKVQDICSKYNISLIGPNCLGIINPHISLNASFAASKANPGNIAFISQSGALCTAILDSASSLGLGFSKFISVGNKAVIDEVELFNYLANDDKTKIVAVYAEQLSNPKEIIKASLKLRKKGKPLLILKAGKSMAGAKASASHTGALAGSDKVYDALFNQAGIIRVDKIEELFNYIKIFNNDKLIKSKNIAIITNAGGPGVVSVDCIEKNNLSLAKLSKKTKDSLKNILPPAASYSNPVDILGDAKASRYKNSLEQVVIDKNVDSVIVILSPQSSTDVVESAKAIIEINKKHKKPIIPVFMGDHLVVDARDFFIKNNISSYLFPEDAVKSLAVFNDFYQLKNKKEKEKKMDFSDVNYKKVEEIFSEASKNNKKSFPEAEAREVFSLYNFEILKSYVAKSKLEAKKYAKKIDKDLVLKIVSPDILHKSDVSGIILDVKPNEVEKMYDLIIKNVKARAPKARIEGVLVTEMLKDDGIEIILGAFKDPALGQTIMVGLGGIYVEVFKDVSFGLNPLKYSDAKNMINSLKSIKLLEGVRGQKEKDVEALIEAILRLAKLLDDFPEIKELDINPLFVLDKGKGVKVLDSRIILE